MGRPGVRESRQWLSERAAATVDADQDGTINLFRGLGFTPEALHRDQVRADDGTLLDILVLAHSIDDNCSAITELGLGLAR